MKKILLILISLISVLGFSQKPNSTSKNKPINNKDTLYYWKGKKISSKALDDSLDAYFKKYVDSVKSSRKVIFSK